MLSVFLSLVFAISLAIIKTAVKNIFWRVFFSKTGQSFFSFFEFVSFTWYVLFFEFFFKIESGPLYSEFLTGLYYA